MPASYRIRRCEVVLLEPREVVSFSLDGILTGGSGLIREKQWLALAPHLAEPVVVSTQESELLGALSPSEWVVAGVVDGALASLIDKGLAVVSDGEHAAWREHSDRDEAIRQSHWHPLTAVMHAFTRWSDVDAVKNTEDAGVSTAPGMLEVLGHPPSKEFKEALGEPVSLPMPERTQFDALLNRRTTCRNFDRGRPLPLAIFTQVLHRAFGAQSSVRVSEELTFEKRNNPSGGGLHPCGAYLVVQNVEGVRPGLYQYMGMEHQLIPLPDPEGDLHEFAMKCLAQQHWFANAHCLVLIVADFDRTFWKYRRHAKGYRVVALEAGHISQNLYLAATESGASAFITGAINERDIEKAFGLDSTRQGVLAATGFGWRAEKMETAELDPLQLVWQRVD